MMRIGILAIERPFCVHAAPFYVADSECCIRFSFLYSEGEMPIYFLNTRLNWEKLLKPHKAGISVMGMSVLIRMA